MAQEGAVATASTGHDEAEVLVMRVTSNADESPVGDQPHSTNLEVGPAATSVVGKFELIPRQRLSLKARWENFSRGLRYSGWRKGRFTPSPYFSTRIQRLSEQRHSFESELEFEIESSKSHWTQTSISDEGCEQESNSDVFQRLKEHPEWGPFFRREPYALEIGEKIAEGGQAEIFEALGSNRRDHYSMYSKSRHLYMRDNITNEDSDGPKFLQKRELVVKVFREGFPLEELQRFWPPGLATAALPHRYFRTLSDDPGRVPEGNGSGLCWAVGAQLLMDDRFTGRFAFVFDRFWGDLRKLIDLRMLKSNGTPPFSSNETRSILLNIARGMASLHKLGLLHKDLKAANVLMTSEVKNYRNAFSAYITDFESSVGIVGTGFWRAPEVLLALRKNRRVEPDTFTQQTDVYSYAMTCYEVITGRVPFEGHPQDDYEIVLGGTRPELPDDTSPQLKSLLRKCWHEDPLQRPLFVTIVEDLE